MAQAPKSWLKYHTVCPLQTISNLHLFWRQKKPGDGVHQKSKCESILDPEGQEHLAATREYFLRSPFKEHLRHHMCNPFVHETQVTKFQKLNCWNIIMSIAQYQHLHYHWDIDANSSWNSQCESWRKSDSTRLGHAHQLSRIWDPKWVFLKAYDNPIVVWQGFLKCTRYNPSSLNGDGIKKNPLSAGVKFRGFSKFPDNLLEKIQGNFPGLPFIIRHKISICARVQNSSQGLNHSPDRLWGPIPNHSGAASSRMLKVLPITVTPSWNGQKLGFKTVKRKTHTQKNGKWTGHSFFTRTSKHFGMILYVFCTTLPLSLISSTASPLYAYMFFFELPGDSFTTSWPEIGTIRTLPNPHRGWSRSRPQHIIVPSAALRKMIGPWLKVCCQCEAEKNWGSWHPSMTYPAEASPWMTWCRGWCPMKKTQVAPIWWGSTRDEFKFPVCLWTLDYVQLQSMQFHIWICVQNQNAHENSWKFMTKASRLWLTRSALDRKMSKILL